MKAVIINGYSGCGKDTFVQNVSKQASVINWSIADFARYKVIEIIGETDASAKASDFVDDYRRALIHITNIAKRKGIVWKELKDCYEANKDKNILFIHCRDPHDFDKIKEVIPDVVTLWVTREDISPANEQDFAAINYTYDIYIRLAPLNSEEYSEQITDFISRLGEK